MNIIILFILSFILGVLLGPLKPIAFAAVVVIYAVVAGISYYEGMQHKEKGVK